MPVQTKQPIMEWKNKTPFFIALMFSILGLCLRLLHLTQHELSVDEYYQLGIMTGSFWDMVKAIPAHEFGAYLSGDLYLVYPFFKVFGYHLWGLAIPHIMMTIMGFCLLYMVCNRFFKTPVGYLITFSVVCFNNTLIVHATEIRWYAVLPTLALLSLYLSDKLVNEYDSISKRQKIVIGVLFVATSWFHLYGVLMPLLSVSFFLFSKSRDKGFGTLFKKVLRFMLRVGMTAAPLWVLSVFGTHLQTGGELRMDPFLFIPNPAENFFGFLKAIFGNLVGHKMFYFLLIGFAWPFLNFGTIGLRQIAFLLVMIILPIAFLLTLDVCSEYYFVQRQFIWVMPFFAIFLGWAWETFFQQVSGCLFKT